MLLLYLVAVARSAPTAERLLIYLSVSLFFFWFWFFLFLLGFLGRWLLACTTAFILIVLACLLACVFGGVVWCCCDSVFCVTAFVSESQHV